MSYFVIKQEQTHDQHCETISEALEFAQEIIGEGKRPRWIGSFPDGQRYKVGTEIITIQLIADGEINNLEDES